MFKFLFKSALFLVCAFALITTSMVVALKYVNPSIWAWRFEQDRLNPVHHEWVSLDHISHAMQLSVIAGEDQTFAHNDGFDYSAILAAYEHNLHSDQIYGASTITQQTAKNLFLWPTRTYTRKLIGAWFTFLIDHIWSKQRVLEVYLNVIQLGPRMYGVNQAAQYYFNTTAANLTPTQASYLAASLPNPGIYRVKPLSPLTVQRGNWIHRQMVQLSYLPLRHIGEKIDNIYLPSFK